MSAACPLLFRKDRCKSVRMMRWLRTLNSFRRRRLLFDGHTEDIVWHCLPFSNLDNHEAANFKRSHRLVETWSPCSLAQAQNGSMENLRSVVESPIAKHNNLHHKPYNTSVGSSEHFVSHEDFVRQCSALPIPSKAVLKPAMKEWEIAGFPDVSPAYEASSVVHSNSQNVDNLLFEIGLNFKNPRL